MSEPTWDELVQALYAADDAAEAAAREMTQAAGTSRWWVAEGALDCAREAQDVAADAILAHIRNGRPRGG